VRKAVRGQREREAKGVSDSPSQQRLKRDGDRRREDGE
jgi:hypothetical protein